MATVNADHVQVGTGKRRAKEQTERQLASAFNGFAVLDAGYCC